MLLHPANFLIMTSRPWRLCPDLNAYPDEQCKAFLDRAVRSRQMGLFAAFACAVVIGVTSFLGMTAGIEHFAGRNSAWLDSQVWQGRAGIAAQATVMFLLVGAIAPVPYVVLLRRGVHEVLDRAKCPTCEYSLQGLTVENDRVRCPECGKVIALGTLGLTPDSIALGRPVPTTTPTHAVDPRPNGRSKFLAATGACVMVAWIVVGWTFLSSAAIALFMYAAFGPAFRAYAADQTGPG